MIMEKYCCFLHPKVDYELKHLDERCPDCGLPYGFPLAKDLAPRRIGRFKVVRPINRGYYGATYIVEKKTAIKTKKLVLKVVPKALYSFFNKDFEAECKAHAIAAEKTHHIVDIDDIFDEEVVFGETQIDCHVAVLQYVNGQTLKEIIDSSEPVRATAVGQVAIDLLRILSELQSKRLFHNDLHPGNIMIEELDEEHRRLGELDEAVKAVAIDFGSLDTKTLSGDSSNRIGDLHRVAETLDDLSKKILNDPANADERDYRLASLLEERARLLFPAVESQRTFQFEELIDQIRNAFIQVSSPWKASLQLKNFKDSYNAQTMLPWFVPSLLVDDDDKWISEISNRGPQVITGMRGCGKTMLLRALQFHARAIPSNENELDSEVIERLKKEGYIGLYVSCTRLLDRHGHQSKPIHQPFARLFVAYALEAINAIRHLRELDRKCVQSKAYHIIAKVVSEHVENTSSLLRLSTEHQVEVFLKGVLNSLSKGEKLYTINASPANSFPALAQAVCECSTIWNNHYLFFLLDDVSTRFLNDDNIIHLVSTLLFQNEYCGFKFTTEMQTLEMVINSPGNIEQAREGRDYSVFDLGDEVNEKIHANKHEGIRFVEKILMKRSKFHSGHPRNLKPSEVLGSTTLKKIAESIARKGKASDKKGIYYGITAIASVCVGDIGDVITLYDMILNKGNRENGIREYPISPVLQNECYLELCNSRLYDINRRESRLYNFAESFAQAAHHLLVQSYKARKNGDDSAIKLRQYASIFVNITTGDIKRQYAQVRELIDAGIFNFSGGPEASRTNRQGVNPQQQFKLVYRKLYGISNHMGLSNADRFELSGEQLERWLNHPKEGKEILIRNLKSTVTNKAFNQEKSLELLADEENPEVQAVQKSLFENEVLSSTNHPNRSRDLFLQNKLHNLAKEKLPSLERLALNDLQDVESLKFIAGLGFEERTLVSFYRWIKLNPAKVELIEFHEAGNKDYIINKLKSDDVDFSVSSFSEVVSSHKSLDSSCCIDITGLPKAIIFHSVVSALSSQGQAQIIFTEAEKHYPLDADITELLEKYKEDDHTEFLESLTNVLKGEKGPYEFIPLMPISTDNYSTRRILIAFSSPKHERLFSFLDEREYDKIHIIIPSGNSPRDRLARIAAEVALRKFNHAEIVQSDQENLHGLMDYLAMAYQNYFVEQTFSFEIALTGSKIQTVACAAICSTFKVSQVWYVQPYSWDPKKFTEGTLDTVVYSLRTKS